MTITFKEKTEIVFDILKEYEDINFHRYAFCIAMDKFEGIDNYEAMEIANKVNGMIKGIKKERVPKEFDEKTKTILDIIKLYPETCPGSLEVGIERIKFVMEMTEKKTLEEFGEIIEYLEERNERDVYNRTKDNEIYSGQHRGVEALFRDFYSYLKSFEPLIQKNIVPMYPDDVFDIVYCKGDKKYHEEEYYELNDEGYLVLKIRFI